MKVFISWSGELSRDYAEVLRAWLPCVLQAVKPYFTPNDIDKGQRWSSEISQELESSRIGIICLTRENLTAPWIMFEAGALTKALSVSKVTPLLFDELSPLDIQGPLSQFQASIFSKNEIKKLVVSLNKSLEEQALDASVLDETFETFWPKLEKQIAEVPVDRAVQDEFYLRDERSLIKETLQLVRAVYYRDDRYEEIDPLLLRPIEDLDLSDFSRNALHSENLYYIGDLVCRTDKELLNSNEIGKKELSEIKSKLEARGLSLNANLKNWPPRSLVLEDGE